MFNFKCPAHHVCVPARERGNRTISAKTIIQRLIKPGLILSILVNTAFAGSETFPLLECFSYDSIQRQNKTYYAASLSIIDVQGGTLKTEAIPAVQEVNDTADRLVVVEPALAERFQYLGLTPPCQCQKVDMASVSPQAIFDIFQQFRLRGILQEESQAESNFLIAEIPKSATNSDGNLELNSFVIAAFVSVGVFFCMSLLPSLPGATAAFIGLVLGASIYTWCTENPKACTKLFWFMFEPEASNG